MDHLRVFHEVARALTQTLDLEAILLIIMEKMAQFFGPERWSMLLVDEHSQQLYYVIAVGEDAESLRGLHVPMGEGVAGWVAATGNSLVVPDVSLDAQWSEFAKAHPELNIQSIACVPVRSGDQTLGVIQLLNSKLDLLSEYSISFLRILCDYAAIAIRNARSVERIHELTITDDCTGLFNARHLYTMLDEQLALFEANPSLHFSLLFVDLDHFKEVNDTHGHLVGSRLLAEVGSLMKRSLGPNNACFRYGGDEFVALLPGLGKQSAIAAAKRLWDQLRQEKFLSGQGLNLNLAGSFGLATFPEDGDTVPAIIRTADTMMYEAKTTRDNIAVAGVGLIAGSSKAQNPASKKASTMLANDLESKQR
jgi:diguanylate cyclase (GGDEF)-like protein